MALLAQAYRTIFRADLDTETIHAAFHIPINEEAPQEVNFALNKYNVIIIDKASLVSSHTFSSIATPINCLDCRPVVIIAGDKCQQQPLQTVQGRVSYTISILNDTTFHNNSVKHTLYHQFQILDSNYASFVDFIRHVQPSQEQLDEFQRDIILYPSRHVGNKEIFQAFKKLSNTTMTTISHAAAQRVNQTVVDQLFANQVPLTTVRCAFRVQSKPIYLFCRMEVIIKSKSPKSRQELSNSEWSRSHCCFILL